MRISDEAQTLIKKALDSSDYDSLAVVLKDSCCGTTVDFWLGNLEEGDEPEIINGIPVMMDAQVKERTENVILTVENGELVVRDEGPPCGC